MEYEQVTYSSGGVVSLSRKGYCQYGITYYFRVLGFSCLHLDHHEDNLLGHLKATRNHGGIFRNENPKMNSIDP